jgi:hypothetical protein
LVAVVVVVMALEAHQPMVKTEVLVVVAGK